MAAGGDLDMNARNSEGNSNDETDEPLPLAWEQPEESLPEDHRARDPKVPEPWPSGPGLRHIGLLPKVEWLEDKGGGQQ